MARIILKLVFIFICLISSLMMAQDFHGTAIYETKAELGSIKVSSNDLAIKMNIEERIKKAMEKTYILIFNKKESMYSEEVELESPEGIDMQIFKMYNTDGRKTYKNIQDRIEITEKDFFGKEFLLQDSLPIWNWKLDGETKKIGNYTCYKASVMVPVSEEAKKNFEENKKKNSENNTQFTAMDEPKDKTITAWYAPEIPVSLGPEKYWGLPGLILEANDGNIAILCSKIILNPKKKIEIKRPNKGKKVNKKQYEEITSKLLESMKNRNGSIEIRSGAEY
ncbi:MAG TPA: GLPGLI family protein [Flavobacterium sp.]|nr:GLPGLI family protein [Flavobacterium sp.]